MAEGDFIKRHIVERTNKIKTGPREQSEKQECCQEDYGIKYS